MGRRLTTEEFIKKARDIHGDKYDYSGAEYIGDKSKVLIYCKIHGSFWQSPGHHIRRKHGCPLCKGRNISSTCKKNYASSFISSAKVVHGDKYDYSEVEYINAKSKVIIICREHGEFCQTPNIHLSGKGCQLCGYNRVSKYHLSDTDDFVKKAIDIHDDCYNYEKVKYVNNKVKVIIICKNGHEFKQTPADHLSKRGCPHCYKKNEWIVGEILKRRFKNWNIYSQIQVWSSFKDYLKPRYCDFWLEKNNIKIMVEYDGEQHFRPVRFYSISKEKAEMIFKRRQYIDNLDKEFCEENDVILHRIRYDDDKEKSIARLKNGIREFTKQT